MPEPESVSLRAHAKLNLTLSVGPPIADGDRRGFHPIASWFAAIDLADSLSVRRLPPGTPSRFSIRWAPDAPKTSPINWPLEKDLAVRAHALVERVAGRALPVDMVLVKRIPVGGGLGGGSSDAAAMLAAVVTLFGLPIGRPDLRALSAGLGSDVAFFLDDSPVDPPRPAIVTGFGEKIERLDDALGAEVLLIVPPFGCPTGPVYKAFDSAPRAELRPERVRAIRQRSRNRGRIDSADLFNDLADPACTVEPMLGETLERLRAALGEVPVHVTGSGSTMFVLVSAGDGDRTAGLIRAAGPELVVVTARLI